MDLYYYSQIVKCTVSRSHTELNRFGLVVDIKKAEEYFFKGLEVRNGKVSKKTWRTMEYGFS